MAFVLALLALFALFSVVHGAPVASSGLPAPSWLPTDFPLSSFSRHALLADNVHMYWTLDTGKNSMLVGVVGTFDRDAEGSYLGIGLSPTGGMKGSDIVLGFTDVSGKFMIQNRHAGGFYQPALASRQFAKLEYGVQSGNITAFVFSRPIVVDSSISCSDSDSKDWTDPDLRLQQWIVFAAGSMSRDRSNPMYHGPGDRGQVAVFLDGPETEPPKHDDGTETKFLELLPSEPIELPRNESTVYCYTYLELPRDRPYDAISISPILPPRGASPMRPHHFIVYNWCAFPSFPLLSAHLPVSIQPERRRPQIRTGPIRFDKVFYPRPRPSTIHTLRARLGRVGNWWQRTSNALGRRDAAATLCASGDSL